jgi:hypothetical protein
MDALGLSAILIDEWAGFFEPEPFAPARAGATEVFQTCN